MRNTSILSDQSIELSIRSVAFYKWLTETKHEFIMAKQFLRSSTSIGANIHEAQYAASKADFINKMQIALKEASETEYWLTVLKATGYYEEQFSDICQVCTSIKRMLTATINTAKNPPE